MGGPDRAMLRSPDALPPPETWRAGDLNDNGRIVFDDGMTARLAGPLTVRCGRVVVLPSRSSSTTAYRESPMVDASSVIAASPEELADAVQASLDARYTFALAALSLTGAPLVVACAHGLVFG
jgi:hypothetical protein